MIPHPHGRKVAYLCGPFHTLMFAWDMTEWVVLSLQVGDEVTIPFDVMGNDGKVSYGGQTTIEHGAPKTVPKDTARAIWNSLRNSNWQGSDR